MVTHHTMLGTKLIALIVLAGACAPEGAPPTQNNTVEAAKTPSASKTKPRVQFLIGLGDIGGRRSPSINAKNEDGSVRSIAFDQKKAEAQRAKAIEAGHRDGTSYQLRDGEGQPLPVFWKPWIPWVATRKLDVSAEDITAALTAARAGQPYDAKLVTGGWLYAPPEWYGDGLQGFTEEMIYEVKPGTSYNGHRAVNYQIKISRQGDFEAFTSQFIDHTKCLILDDEILTNPTIRAALSDAVQITGGGETGFAAEEQNLLIRALSGK